MCLKKIGKNVNPNPGGVPGFCLELDAGGGYVGQAYMHWCIFCVHEFRGTTAQAQLPGVHEVLRTSKTPSKSEERGMNFSSMEWTFLVQKPEDKTPDELL